MAGWKALAGDPSGLMVNGMFLLSLCEITKKPSKKDRARDKVLGWVVSEQASNKISWCQSPRINNDCIIYTSK
jgi:hypothetical protein